MGGNYLVALVAPENPVMPDGGQSVLEKFCVPLIADGDGFRRKLKDLCSEGLDITASRETDNLESIRKTANDVEDIDTD
ncbi:hypothetical protein HNQ81_002083 [Desulfoprunum benzoelyticum]|uniref:Uncharacterized protein n=1 Tax=Desulfoprunum benzoelyticum TaxID=1506996 RepID=A0A840V0E4_9BACT|nr:hypothetical protein [Desulfoprunum benzoelyticum]